MLDCRYMPTSAEITQFTRAIRSDWNADEQRDRRRQARIARQLLLRQLSLPTAVGNEPDFEVLPVGQLQPGLARIA